MDEKNDRIRASCPLFACRVCRTKTGWPHQRWCECQQVLEPVCEDCRYYHSGKDACVHPAGKGVSRL